MQLRRLVYSDRHQFLGDYLEDFATGGLFVPGGDPLELGEPVLLEIVFPEIPEGVFVSGRTVWRRLATRWKSALPCGVGIEFDSSERPKRDFLLDFARGSLASMRKRSRRIPIRLKVDYSPIDRPIAHAQAETRDIGRGGLFLHTGALARYGSSLHMTLFPPNPLSPAQAVGRVAWIGHMQGITGMGIQFLFRSRDARIEIDRIVSGLEDQLSRGVTLGSA
ncbi:MAG: PilZ domain-containing protein [Deltaproteobacteria bacterium]|nr:PilZ domain-containing protein [Deltaproteobacteria bacterium]